MEHAAKTALAAMGQDLDEVLACEAEPGLGNGGLGRLAACYLDSLATLERPAIGYGIRTSLASSTRTNPRRRQVDEDRQLA